MYKIILSVDGMMCKMCEAHVNDAINKAFENAKVTSSHQDKKTVVLSKYQIDKEKLKTVVESQGFIVKEIIIEEQKKKGLFGFLKK